MSMSDPIADMLTRIRNGQQANKKVVSCPFSSFKKNILEVLIREGYIRGYTSKEIRKGVSELIIELKYYEGNPAIKQLRKVSSPGRRVYSKIKDLSKIYNGLGISILSTPKGLMSDSEARAKNVGGEVLASVY